MGRTDMLKSKLKRVAPKALALLAFVATGAAAQAEMPQMIVKIYNNSTNTNIYPLISFPGQGSTKDGEPGDKWIQGFLGVTTGRVNTDKYVSTLTMNGKPAVTRMYVNCCEAGENGIPPGGSATIRLPLYSPLVDSIVPTKANQLIEWWQGGNINIYFTPTGVMRPPSALKAHWDEPDSDQQAAVIKSGPPVCAAPTKCHLYHATTGNPIAAEPQQLVEFTLGAAPTNPDRTKAGEPFYLFDPNNVDYDVSYVNTVYLPVVMEPVGNPLMGWVGAPDRIGAFSTSITNFLNGRLNNGVPIVLGKGWPLLKDNNGRAVQRKVPSALEIFAQSVTSSEDRSKDGRWVDPPHFIPAPASSPPIARMIKRWRDCQSGSDAQICSAINDVATLLRANFKNYATNYKNNSVTKWGCDQTKKPHPGVAPTELQLLQHLYGWQPFNEHCAADANLLQDTPGYNDPKKLQNYQKVKNQFDQLQYWVDVLNRKYGEFHPFVSLIHGPDYLDAPYTYAYSVDDAVGNVQTDGTGVIVAVGGLENLPNPDHATPDVHFNFPYKSLSNGNTFDFYGRCSANPTTPTNPNFSSFAVPIGVTRHVWDCPISLKDNKGRVYQLQVDDAHPPQTWPWWYPEISGDANARLPIQDSCIRNADQAIRNWCGRAFAFRKKLDDARQTVEYHVNIIEPLP